MIKFAIVSIISAILSGMGIGGGALFVIIATVFLEIEQKEAQAINLIMFLAAAFSSTLFNLKNKTIEKGVLKKIIPLIIMGSFIGTILVKNIQNDNLKLYFNIFMLLIGAYEIISSLINIKKAKNNTKNGKEC